MLCTGDLVRHSVVVISHELSGSGFVADELYIVRRSVRLADSQQRVSCPCEGATGCMTTKVLRSCLPFPWFSCALLLENVCPKA